MIHIMIQYPFSSCEVETCHEIFKGNRWNSWKWNVVNSMKTPGDTHEVFSMDLRASLTGHLFGRVNRIVAVSIVGRCGEHSAFHYQPAQQGKIPTQIRNPMQIPRP